MSFLTRIFFLLIVVWFAGLDPVDAEKLRSSQYTTPLPTGVRLDPAGQYVDLGSMPLAMVVAPSRKRVVVVLGGWRQQGIQVVDLETSAVVQTIEQPAAFYGLAFSPDGLTLYVSGGNDDSIFCYSWKDDRATLERRIVLGVQKSGKAVLGLPESEKAASKYPAGIAVSKDGKFLYVAENVNDTVAVVDLATSEVVQRFATDHYPYAIEVADNMVYVSAWGGQTVSSFRMKPDGKLVLGSRLTVGRHPSALTSDAASSRLFVAVSGSDRIAIVDTRKFKVLGYLNDSAPGSPDEGSTPDALVLSQNGSKLYAAEADNNAVAIFDLSHHEEAARSQPNFGHLIGRIPTDWYPTSVILLEKQLLVLNGKGHGSTANPDGPVPTQSFSETKPTAYDLGQLNGSLRMLANSITPTELTGYSKRVFAANGWTLRRQRNNYPPFKHVVYIIKENRTYDQVLGDLNEGDGDPSLVFFGREISPNHHALALRFGLFDRFFTNAEVSSQGHIWSTAAYVTEYGEKTIPSLYSDRRGDVDGEEAEEPDRGFLWTLAAKNGISFRDYGEMVAGPAWPITQRELGSDVCPNYPPFDATTSDQKRADVWIAELNEFVQNGNLPQLEVMHLPNDHLAGGRAGKCTPSACMADNDLALGRIVEALSRSPYWKDTVIFVVEDDAQAGPDHLDSHRAPFFAISAYSRAGTNHRFINTTDVVAAIEDILSMGRLSKFDYFSRSLADTFNRQPDLRPYTPLIPQVNLGEKNPPQGAAAKISEMLDFSGPDRVNDALYNQLLWSMIKGNESMPVAEGKAPVHIFQLGR